MMVKLDKKPSVLGSRKVVAEVVKPPSYERYQGAELRPFEGRQGAMDAFKLPSLRGSHRVQPQMYMAKGEQ